MRLLETTLKYIGTSLMALLGVAIPFYFISSGINYADEPFQIMSAVHYEKSASTILSQYIMNLWGRHFDFSLYSMRVLMFILYQLSVFISCAYYYYRKRNLANAIALFGITAILMLHSPCSSQLVGWDMVSNFFLIQLLVLLLFKSASPPLLYLVACGIISAFCVLARIPNVMVVFICCIAFRYTYNNKSNIAIYFGALAIGILAIIIPLYGGIGEYIHTFQTYGTVSGHSTSKIIHSYLFSFEPLLIGIGFIYALNKGMQKIDNSQNRTTIYILTTCIFLFTCHYLYQYDYSGTGVVSASFLAWVTFYALYSYGTSCSLHSTYNALVILAIMFMPIVGSDTGSAKLMTAILFPIILSHANFQPVKRLTLGAIACGLLLYAPASKMRAQFFEAGARHCTIETKVPRLANIYTTHEKADIINSVYDQTKDDDVLFIGSPALLFEYIILHTPSYCINRFHRDLTNVQYIEETIIYLHQNANIVKCIVFDKTHEGTLLYQRLKELGFVATHQNDFYCVYERK